MTASDYAARLIGFVLPVLFGLVPPIARAQAPLFLVNGQTTVRGISFVFEGERPFEEATLKDQIALTEPDFWDGLKKILPFTSPRPHPFNPVELQKDVIRLEHYFRQNGYLHPAIDYEASELDTSSNTIRIVFDVDKGPPLIIQDVGFYGPDGRFAFYLFEEGEREAWIKLRDAITVRTGDRYTDFDRLRIHDQALTWLLNNGHAFARMNSEVAIDSTANTVDLRFLLDPGPLAAIDSILVEGNTSVRDEVIIRELPFRRGQPFSQRKLTQAQRELFELNLFRLALTSVPEQTPDSTVNVLVRVREARLRYTTAQTGYGRDNGLRAEGEWTHRNFLGEARSFTVNALANTGILARPSGENLASRLFRISATLRQPFLFVTNLSGSVAPFIQFESNPKLLAADNYLNINSREAGVTTTLLYELYPFRTISLTHNFSRAFQSTRPNPDIPGTIDAFNRSVFSTRAILGKVDDFLNPGAGFLARPVAEFAGLFLGSDVAYIRTGAEISGYLPVSDGVTFAGRVTGNRLWPSGRSARALRGALGRQDSLLYENRFDPVLFYTGGANNLRGWANQMAGDKVAQVVVISGRGADTTYVYEPVGGRLNALLNLEARLPFPGLGKAWGTAAFLDGGSASDRLSLSDFKWGTGLGIRYRTLVGFIRLDVAYKLNPDPITDFYKPQRVWEYERGLVDDLGRKSWRSRFAIHLSIGQAF